MVQQPHDDPNRGFLAARILVGQFWRISLMSHFNYYKSSN